MRGSRAHRTVVVVATTTVLLLAACSGDQSVAPSDSSAAADDVVTAADGSSTSGTPIPSATIGAAAAPSDTSSTPTRSDDAPPDAGAAGDPAWVEVAAGLDEPAALLVDPRSGKDLVVQLGGRIVELDGTPRLDLSDRVQREGERGLLDAAVTPEGDAVIVHYSAVGDGHTVLSRLPTAPDGDLADPADEQVLLELAQPASNHNGGSVVFGPDGMLYLALGDGGRANDAFGNGGDPGTPLGAILRLDVTSDPGSLLVPDDNPFVGGGGDERVWAHGLRNPWRIATDGTSWFVADVGQDAVEEVTVVPADGGPHDLGWPAWEGDFCRVDVCDAQASPPVSTLTHADGACSIIGAAVATTPSVDDGAAFWTDFCDTRVWRLGPDGDVTEDAPLPDGVPAYALDVDRTGAVVALTTDGRVLRRTRA